MGTSKDNEAGAPGDEERPLYSETADGFNAAARDFSIPHFQSSLKSGPPPLPPPPPPVNTAAVPEVTGEVSQAERHLMADATRKKVVDKIYHAMRTELANLRQSYLKEIQAVKKDIERDTAEQRASEKELRRL